MGGCYDQPIRVCACARLRVSVCARLFMHTQSRLLARALCMYASVYSFAQLGIWACSFSRGHAFTHPVSNCTAGGTWLQERLAVLSEPCLLPTLPSCWARHTARLWTSAMRAGRTSSSRATSRRASTAVQRCHLLPVPPVPRDRHHRCPCFEQDHPPQSSCPVSDHSDGTVIWLGLDPA